MAEISAKNVAALRKITGAGMMDCKKALEENSGDVERSKDWLREKGSRAQRSARAARPIRARSTCSSTAASPRSWSSTARPTSWPRATSSRRPSRPWRSSSPRAAPTTSANLSFEGVTVGEHIAQMSATMGEKIELGRVARFETIGGVLDAYKHVQSERGVIGVLVEVTGSAGPRAG